MSKTVNREPRPSFEENAMNIAAVVALRSEDKFVKVGSVGVSKDGTFVATGYNGLPSGFDLTEQEMDDRSFRRSFIVHSEINTLIRAPRYSIDTLCVTMAPCLNCLNVAAAHGVRRILYAEPYSHESYGALENTHKIAERLNIELVQWKPKEKTI